ALVSLAEAHVAAKTPPARAAAPPAEPSKLLPILRGVVGRRANGRAPDHWVLDHRAGEAALALVNDPRLETWARRGVATPDHVIPTKRTPLVLKARGPDLHEWRLAAEWELDAYIKAYDPYFDRHNTRAGGGKTELDPLPRVIAVPGLGLVGI